MKRRRHTPEQIVRKLAVAGKFLVEGKTIEEVCRDLEVTESTLHRWRNQYRGMKAGDAKRLKHLLAEAELDKAMLKELPKGSERRACAVGGQPRSSQRLGVPVIDGEAELRRFLRDFATAS